MTGARWSPRSVNYAPGDGTLPRGPWVHVLHHGEWVETNVLFQSWMTPVGEEGAELAREWWCSFRVRGFGFSARAVDVDWGDPDPALPWLAARCSVSVEEAARPVAWG